MTEQGKCLLIDVVKVPGILANACLSICWFIFFFLVLLSRVWVSYRPDVQMHPLETKPINDWRAYSITSDTRYFHLPSAGVKEKRGHRHLWRRRQKWVWKRRPKRNGPHTTEGLLFQAVHRLLLVIHPEYGRQDVEPIHQARSESRNPSLIYCKIATLSQPSRWISLRLCGSGRWKPLSPPQRKKEKRKSSTCLFTLLSSLLI